MTREKSVGIGEALYEKIIKLMGVVDEYDDGDALVAETRCDGLVTKVFLDHGTGRVTVYSQDPRFMIKLAEMADGMRYAEFSATF
jgi:hypothetical protein